MDSSGVYAGGSERDSEAILQSGQPLKVTTIWHWDGTTWTELPGKFTNGEEAPSIWALLMHEGKLYVGGAFCDAAVTLQDGSTLAPEIDANGVAVWDGTTWSALAEGVTGTVYDLEVWDDKLYAGGQFTCANGQNLAYWQFPVPGSAPVAVDDAYDVAQDSSAVFPVLDNDSDPDGEALKIVACLTASAQGAVTVSTDSLTLGYQPPEGYTGEDTFCYVVTDPIGRRDTATVTVNVIPSTGVDEAGLPRTFALHQNHPNPFNPTTTLGFDLPLSVEVKVEIFDALGRKVRTLKSCALAAGRYQLEWDARDDHGTALASGVYLCRVEAGPWRAVRKMLLLR